ncbi:hypothetical protein [Sediminispirochaeta bajacaliforniensis]|uniref:hypothetical protein n=1 Tax=Sediminispirochaeta bajacaliforniensis TaxID=148 RepID=UPI00037277C0|nr:hypothetical protein [Sediminispirochaeta bajacaliforniensis]
MKKFLVVMITLTMFAPMLMADDAKVLPKGVLRTYLIPAYSFGDQKFDGDGDKVDGAEMKLFNLSLAAEYGLNDFVTVALQWAPGYNLYGTTDAFDDSPYVTGDASVTGPFELFAGTKVQVIGPKAPVLSEKVRLAVAAGLIIPMAFGYDAEDEVTNASSGKDFQILASENNFGLGTRFYADYILTKEFYVNFYNEFKYYFSPVDSDKSLQATMAGVDEVDYGYNLIFELEPHFDKPIADGLIFEASLPVTYEMAPETEYDGVGQDDASKSLTLTPGVGLFVTKSLIPVELSLDYELPLWGENSLALQSVIFKLKAYMKF